MPKIAYVCESCWESASESSCYADRADLRVMPDGTWLCDGCFDEVRTVDLLGREAEDEFRPSWSSFPLPPEVVVPPTDQ